MWPTNSHDIEKLSGRIHSALRLISIQLDCRQVHLVVVVNAQRSSIVSKKKKITLNKSKCSNFNYSQPVLPK